MSSTEIINSDCLAAMRDMAANSIDFIVTDPPYGLKFMGKQWDHGIPSVDYWSEMLRICKPGSMLVAFGGTRTYHRLTCAIEDAGWEIRDCIMWLYGSGFPKSHNKFGLEGYGTALKPAYEPIILAMKPLDGTYHQNAQKWGVAGINIDNSRIEGQAWKAHDATGLAKTKFFTDGETPVIHKEPNSLGRWPANLILDEEGSAQLDQMTGNNVSRFFYCAKASSAERNAGLEGLLLKQTMGGVGLNNTDDDVCGKYGSIKAKQQNSHPTVKPLSLMRYIIKLLAPPNDPILLDPFMGSGSTLCAAKQLGIRAIGIELDPEYCEIARRRVAAVKNEPKQLELPY